MDEKELISFAISLVTALCGGLITMAVEIWKSNREVKTTFDQRKIDFEAAKKIHEICALPDTDKNKLTKRRFAKFILNNDHAGFQDLLLLMRSNDIDYWSVEYFKNKKLLNVIYNNNTKSEIVLLTYDFSNTKIILLAIGYFIFAMLAAIPYIFSGWFIGLVENAKQDHSYFLVSFIITICILSFLIAIWCLRKVMKERTAKDFVIRFYERGIYHMY